MARGVCHPRGIGGSVRFRLDASDVLLRRRNGRRAARHTCGLSLDGDQSRCGWSGAGLASQAALEGIYGLLSGQGSLGLQPLVMQADLTLKRPGLMVVQLQQILLSGRHSDVATA